MLEILKPYIHFSLKTILSLQSDGTDSKFYEIVFNYENQNH